MLLTEVDEPDEMLAWLKLGAADFLTLPLRAIDVLPRVWRLKKRDDLEDSLLGTRAAKSGLHELVGESQEFLKEIEKTNVKVVTRAPMSNPHATQDITSAMLARYSDLDVIFAPWDLPADGVMAALSAAGAKIPVAHIDLGFTGATQIACGTGPVFVMSSQLVYEWGRTGAIAGALHELGQPVPPYIVVPVFAVTKDNLKDGWNLAYGATTPLPAAAQKCLGN